MSLFEDDFYSTKVSKKAMNDRRTQGFRWRGRGDGFSQSRRRGNGRWILEGGPLRLASVSAVTGAFAMLLLVWFIGGHHSASSTAALALTSTAAKAGDVHQTSADSVVNAAEKVRPAIVSVVSARKDETTGQTGEGIGSGVIFQKNGDKVRILTNNHVVDGGTSFDIVMANGERRKGTLIGKDLITDLAILEMDGSGVKSFAEFGDSAVLKAGETVIALGNPLGLGSSPTVTRGIVSSPKRTIPISLSGDGQYDWQMDVIQTDAAINQGNSGGALVNMDGKVVGINTMKIADVGVEGLGFAIPINSAEPVIDSLIKYHKVKRPQLGVRLVDLQGFKGTDVLKLPSEVNTGVIVLEATGPAKDAGLLSQDVITELDGKPITNVLELRKYLYDHKAIGDKIAITYYRGGKKLTASAVLTESPDPEK